MDTKNAGNSSLAAWTAGDAFVFDAFYRAHAKALVRYVQRRFGNGPPDPEDVAHQAFTRLAAQQSVKEIQNPARYLHTIACNIVLDHHRLVENRNQAERYVSVDDVEIVSHLTPEHVLEAKEKLQVFERALEAMPPARRKVFILVRVEGMSARQVAEELLMSEAAVRKHVVRAVADCAAAFQKAEFGKIRDA